MDASGASPTHHGGPPVVGLAALVLPAGNRPEGLPLAVQLAGPGGGKARLVWIAGELERRLPRRRYAAVFYPTASSAPAPV